MRENWVVLSLLVLVAVIGIAAWQLERGDQPIKPSSGAERQAAEAELWTGVRNGWYFGPQVSFRVGRAEVEEKARLAIITRGRESGVVTVENLDLEDSIYGLAQQKGGKIAGRGLIYDRGRRGIALVGGYRVNIKYPGRVEQILRTIRPRSR